MDAQVSPQPPAVGEINSKPTYASFISSQVISQPQTKTQLKTIDFNHGVPTIKFTMEEIKQYSIEEGLHQALVLKFSYGQPEMTEMRKLMPRILGVKGHCIIGWLARRHILIRFDKYEDYVVAASRIVNNLHCNGEDYMFRVFPWSIGFNPKEESSRAFTWISLPNLPPELFAKRALLSIASAAGKPIAIDKATQEKSRPSTARVKIELDLLDKHPEHIRVQYIDEKSGKVIEHVQTFVYDNLPLFCIYCKHQGHDEGSCRLMLNKITDNSQPDIVVEQYQGDVRKLLNEKRKNRGVDNSCTLVHQQGNNANQSLGETEIVQSDKEHQIDTTNVGDQLIAAVAITNPLQTIPIAPAVVDSTLEKAGQVSGQILVNGMTNANGDQSVEREQNNVCAPTVTKGKGVMMYVEKGNHPLIHRKPKGITIQEPNNLDSIPILESVQGRNEGSSRIEKVSLNSSQQMGSSNLRHQIENIDAQITGAAGNDAALSAIDNITRDEAAVHNETSLVDVNKNSVTIPAIGEQPPNLDGNNVALDDISTGKGLPLDAEQGDQLTDDTADDTTSDDTGEDIDASETDTTDDHTAEVDNATNDSDGIDDVPTDQDGQNFSGTNGNGGKKNTTGTEEVISTVTATKEEITLQEKDLRQEAIQQSDISSNPCVNDGWTIVTKKNTGRSSQRRPGRVQTEAPKSDTARDKTDDVVIRDSPVLINTDISTPSQPISIAPSIGAQLLANLNPIHAAVTLQEKNVNVEGVIAEENQTISMQYQQQESCHTTGQQINFEQLQQQVTSVADHKMQSKIAMVDDDATGHVRAEMQMSIAGEPKNSQIGLLTDANTLYADYNKYRPQPACYWAKTTIKHSQIQTGTSSPKETGVEDEEHAARDSNKSSGQQSGRKKKNKRRYKTTIPPPADFVPREQPGRQGKIIDYSAYFNEN